MLPRLLKEKIVTLLPRVYPPRAPLLPLLQKARLTLQLLLQLRESKVRQPRISNQVRVKQVRVKQVRRKLPQTPQQTLQQMLPRLIKEKIVKKVKSVRRVRTSTG